MWSLRDSKDAMVATRVSPSGPPHSASLLTTPAAFSQTSPGTISLSSSGPQTTGILSSPSRPTSYYGGKPLLGFSQLDAFVIKQSLKDHEPQAANMLSQALVETAAGLRDQSSSFSATSARRGSLQASQALQAETARRDAELARDAEFARQLQDIPPPFRTWLNKKTDITLP